MRRPRIRSAALAALAGFAVACRPELPTPPPVVPEQPPAPLERTVLVEYVTELIRTSYAPRQYKTERFGWSLADELARLRRAAEDPKVTDHGFRRALHRLFRSPRDIHTSAVFTQSAAVWLGIHIRRTPSGYRVAWIDPSVVPDTAGLAVGDEVTGFGGKPIADAVRHSEAQTQWRSNPGFTQAFAEWFLVFRAAAEWDEIPAAGDSLVLRVRGGEAERDVTLRWRDAESESGVPPVRRCPFWGKSKASVLPALGPSLWKTEPSAQFPAYTFEDDGRVHGFIRIHSYALGGPDALAAIAEFDRTIDEFAKRGVRAIVIDQLGNGGGNYTFGLTLLSRLSPRPLRPPTQRFIVDPRGALVAFPGQSAFGELLRTLVDPPADASIDTVLKAHPGLTFLPPTRQTAADLREFLRFVVEPPPTTDRLTQPHFQVLRSYPHAPERGDPFTGRVVLLVDALNLSAAEYVAATLRDNGRATLLGTTTSGAGGDQRWFAPDVVCGKPTADPTRTCIPKRVAEAMHALGVDGFTLTVTLGYRTDATGAPTTPIENEGVAPHVRYEISAEDLTSDYAPMKKAVIAALRGADAVHP